MLAHLRITGFALLDDVEVELGPGLNVLTGETGAGKSLVVDAVALLRGGRSSSEVVRSGADEASIEALFSLEPGSPPRRLLDERLAAAGLAANEEDLLIRRVVGRSGRGRVYVNGSLSTVSMLEKLVGELIDLAGQQEHQTLTDPSRHLAILDAYGVSPAARRRAAEAYAALARAARQLDEASLDERSRAEKEDYLRFQLDELEAASLEAGEDDRLNEERARLRHAERLHGVARRGEEALYARDRAIVGELGALAKELDEASRIDPQLAAVARQMSEAKAVLEDAAEALRRYADSTRADPERLVAVEERLHLIGRLLRKHGGDVTEVLERQTAIARELDALAHQEARRDAALAQLQACRRDALTAARAVTEERRGAAGALGRDASRALAELGMDDAKLEVHVAERSAREGDDLSFVLENKRFSETGWDRVELLLAANPGEEARPLARVASGGELSRIMLALKRVLARCDLVSTYVFDEVDSGIGGAVADVVGRLLKDVSREKQVLCVTHLPQIAAYADAHFSVEKRTTGGRTSTVITPLAQGPRVEELARMVGGAKVTPKARAHAEDLIARARAR